MCHPDGWLGGFWCGEGAGNVEVVQKTLDSAHLAGIKKCNPNGNTVFVAEEGFTNEFIAGVMKDVFEHCAEND